MLTMVDDPERGFTLGAADYATKPVDRARLSQILKKYTCPHPPCPVLLVEDDPATREMTRAILEKEGWKVSEAENGRVALECMERERPSLILLDLMMPEMDGFEFAARGAPAPGVALDSHRRGDGPRPHRRGAAAAQRQRRDDSPEKPATRTRRCCARCATCWTTAPRRAPAMRTRLS